MGLTLNVQVLQSGQPPGQLVFDSEKHRNIKIGRLTTAQIKLEDVKVARIHAVIEFAGNDASLIDMGSTQGTLVNGGKVAKCKLSHGDQVMIGDTTLVIGFGSPAAAVASDVSATTKAAPPAAAARPPTFTAINPAFAGAAALATAPGVVAGNDSMRRADVASESAGEAAPLRQATQERLRSAAVESRPHPGLLPEEPLTRDNRVLELRLYWNDALLGMYHYVRPKRVTIGENTRTDIFLSSEGLPTEEFPLIRYKDSEYIFTYTTQMEGEIEIGGQLLSLEDAAQSQYAQRDSDLSESHQIKMTDDMRILLHWGGATFALRFVPPPKIVKAPWGKDLDLQFINSSILSLFLHLALIITLAVYPHDTESLKVDLFGEPDRFASLILEAPKENKSTKDMLEKIKKQVEEKKEQIKPSDDKKKVVKPLDVKNVIPKNIPQPKKSAEDKKAELARHFSKLLGGGGAGNLLGGGGAGSLSGSLQNVIGTAGAGSAGAGLAGIGIRGTGPLTGGGIGTSRGVGGIGTTGRLGGGGLGYGAGIGLGNAKQRSMIDLDTPVIEGALPPDVIKKVINENKNQVRYCYEVELQRNQNLEGRVQVKWIIGATGAVAQVVIKDSSIKNANVENCLIGKIKTWKFPPPAGGGTVEVNYPFVFKAS